MAIEIESNSHEKKKQKLDTKVGLENICLGLFEKILSHIPLKSRTRLKCVSKTWCDSITHLRHSSSLTSSSGLVCYWKKHNISMGHVQIIKFEEQGKEIRGQSLFNFPFHEGKAKLIDSCNGLLLFTMKEHVTYYGVYCRKFFVLNPARNQRVDIPIRQRWSPTVFAGIVSDGSQQHFKVINYSFNKFTLNRKEINCHIFSSETKEWTKHEARIFNSSYSGIISSMCATSLYWKGKLYSVWGKSMLVYDVEKVFFKLVPLPELLDFKPSDSFDRYAFWESEGQLQFCRSGVNGFHIWTYQDLNSDEWLLKQTVTREELRFQYCELILHDDDERITRIRNGLLYVTVFAFNEVMQILYIRASGYILSYSLETRRLAKVWSAPRSLEFYTSTVYPFLFNCTN